MRDGTWDLLPVRNMPDLHSGKYPRVVLSEEIDAGPGRSKAPPGSRVGPAIPVAAPKQARESVVRESAPAVGV